MKLYARVLTVVFCIVGSAACLAEAPELPVPAGSYGVGRIAFDWTDHSRRDSRGADPKRDRELMVYLWYPMERPSTDPHGVYWPGAKAIDADATLGPAMREGYGEVWPEILSGSVYSHAVENAPVGKNPKRFPLVIFSHGLGGSSFGYTALFEAMVSRGYVVAAIEHPGTASVVVFPGGRLVQPFEAPEPAGLTQAQKMQRMMDGAGQEIEVGAADERFVLDRLTQENAGSAKTFALAGRLDLGRVAVAGHSAGADFAARACELEMRFKACVDLDGAMAPVEALPEYPDGKIVQHPLLFLEAYHDETHMYGTHEEKQAFFRKEKEQLAKCPRGSYDVVLNPPGMSHGSFSDAYVLHAGNTAEQRAQALHNLALSESYILAFLDEQLKDLPAPLLDNAPLLGDTHAAQPEVTVTPLGR